MKWWVRGHPAKGEQLVVTDTGIELHGRRRSRLLWTFDWRELEEVVAFKRDMFAVDDLCLGFRAGDAAGFLVCDEEIPGWDEVNAALAARLGIHCDEWVAVIAQPPFAENWTVLWTRSGATAAATGDGEPR